MQSFNFIYCLLINQLTILIYIYQALNTIQQKALAKIRQKAQKILLSTGIKYNINVNHDDGSSVPPAQQHY